MSAAETEQDAHGDHFTADVDRAKLAAFADALTPIVDEARIHADEDGLRVGAVEPANVALVEAEMGCTASADAEHRVGVAVEYLADYLEVLPAYSNREISLAIDQADQSLVLDHAKGEIAMDCISENSLREDASLPDVDHTVTCRADLSVLKSFPERLPRDCRAVEISAVDDDSDAALRLSADTDEWTVTADVPGTITDATGEPATGVFSTDYLRSIFSALPDRMGTVKLGDAVPMTIAYQGDLSVSYHLAPRITAGDGE